jgi:hypothetical protein
MIVAPPPLAEADATPLLVTLTAADSDELQVSGTPVMVVPMESMIVGTIVLEVLVALVTASVIDCTGQVVKLTGTLFALPIVAKIDVRPGSFAVARTWPGNRAGSEVFSVATFATRVCQLKIPTVEVMFTPLLYAVAW